MYFYFERELFNSRNGSGQFSTLCNSKLPRKISDLLINITIKNTFETRYLYAAQAGGNALYFS